MNKNVLKTLLVAVLALFAAACADKKEAEETAANDSAEWTQMDDFHMVMAETFHPYKDSSNLEPVKNRVGELAASAEEWAKAELPAKVDNDEVKSKLQELQEETASLVSTVQTGDDEAIAAQLVKVHDLFHLIQEKWYDNGHHDHDHHGHQH